MWEEDEGGEFPNITNINYDNYERDDMDMNTFPSHSKPTPSSGISSNMA